MALEVNLLKVEQNQVTPVKKESQLFPQHDFAIGYFHSPYNPFSFNAVMEKIVKETLYTILSGKKDSIVTKPDWKAVGIKVAEVKNKVIDYLKDNGAFYKATVVYERETKIDSEEKALKLFRQERSKFTKKPDYGNYTSEQGEFLFSEAWNVVAIIPGTRKVGQKTNKCIYVIHEEKLDQYLQALDIIQETVSYVLSQPNTESYQLQWNH